MSAPNHSGGAEMPVPVSRSEDLGHGMLFQWGKTGMTEKH